MNKEVDFLVSYVPPDLLSIIYEYIPIAVIDGKAYNNTRNIKWDQVRFIHVMNNLKIPPSVRFKSLEVITYDGYATVICSESVSMMFANTVFNGDIGRWNMSNVRDMSRMFYNSPLFDCDISMWDTSNVCDMSKMFYGAAGFSYDISKWDMSSVHDVSSMMAFAYAFDGEINFRTIPKTTDTMSLFNYAMEKLHYIAC